MRVLVESFNNFPFVSFTNKRTFLLGDVTFSLIKNDSSIEKLFDHNITVIWKNKPLEFFPVIEVMVDKWHVLNYMLVILYFNDLKKFEAKTIVFLS
jgi:hypothetical protein